MKLTIGGYWLKPTEFKPNKNKDINTNHKINKNEETHTENKNKIYK